MVPKSWQRTKQEQSKGSSRSSVTFTPMQGWSQIKLSQIGAGFTTAEMQGKNWVSATKRYPRLDLDIVKRCTVLLHVLQLRQDHHWLYDHGTSWHRCWPGAPICEPSEMVTHRKSLDLFLFQRKLMRCIEIEPIWKRIIGISSPTNQ